MHPLKAKHCIDVTDEGIVTRKSDEQSLKANSSIVVTDDGISISVRVHPWKQKGENVIPGCFKKYSIASKLFFLAATCKSEI